ncbi:hypothetical protein TI05_00860 [Achromatium sp. WMS3]|nr:hypothetical protein TI05_00860 [Achromatium sp. WMS3]
MSFRYYIALCLVGGLGLTLLTNSIAATPTDLSYPECQVTKGPFPKRLECLEQKREHIRQHLVRLQRQQDQLQQRLAKLSSTCSAQQDCPIIATISKRLEAIQVIVDDMRKNSMITLVPVIMNTNTTNMVPINVVITPPVNTLTTMVPVLTIPPPPNP